MEQRSTEEREEKRAPVALTACVEALELMDEGVFLIDCELRLKYVNRRGSGLFGKAPGELKGKTMGEVVPESWCPPLAEKLGETVRKRVEDSFEVSCPGFAPAWLYCRCRPVDGGAVVTLQDISQWKTREERFSEQQKKMQLEMDELNAIYRSAPIGLCVLDTDMRYVRINDFLARLNGRPAAEHIGRTPREVAPAFTDEMEQAIRSVIATGEPRLVAELEGKPRPENGESVTFMTHWLPLKDEGGKVVGVNVVVEDTTGSKRARDALEMSEASYRAIFDSANDAIFIHDVRDGAILDANLEASEMYGYTAEEMRRLQVNDISAGEPPYSMEEARRKIILALEGGRQPVFEWRARDKWGQLFWVEVSLKLAVINGEQRIVAIVRDVTRRRHLEESLREAQERLIRAKEELEDKVRARTLELDRSKGMLEGQKEVLQKIIDSIPVMIIFYDPAGVPMMVNEEFTRLMGWSLEEVRGMDILAENFPDPGEREEVRDFIRRAEPGWRDLEPKVRGGNPLLSSWANIRLSDNSLIGIGIDISGRRKMEHDLLRLASAIEQAGEGIVMLDADWVVEYVNPAFVRICGYSREELLGRRVECVRDGFIEEARGEDFLACLSRGVIWTSSQKRRRKDGEWVETTLTVSPVTNGNGRVINYVCVVRDVTREVKLQQQMIQNQKLEAIGTVAGGIAHDLKNIFTPIVLDVEMALEDMGEDGTARALLEETLQAARMGADLTRQIVTFSSSSSHEFKPMKIFQVVMEALAFLKSTLPVNVKLMQAVEESDAVVVADTTQLKQVMLNLGNNAAHALKDKDTGGILEVSLCEVALDDRAAKAVAPELTPGRYACIEFRDNGVGMDDRILQHIFEPFYTTKAKGEGTGMGLAMVHGIVKNHKGAITVRSKPGDGATFRVYLPIAVA